MKDVIEALLKYGEEYPGNSPKLVVWSSGHGYWGIFPCVSGKIDLTPDNLMVGGREIPPDLDPSADICKALGYEPPAKPMESPESSLTRLMRLVTELESRNSKEYAIVLRSSCHNDRITAAVIPEENWIVDGTISYVEGYPDITKLANQLEDAMKPNPLGKQIRLIKAAEKLLDCNANWAAVSVVNELREAIKEAKEQC